MAQPTATGSIVQACNTPVRADDVPFCTLVQRAGAGADYRRLRDLLQMKLIRNESPLMLQPATTVLREPLFLERIARDLARLPPLNRRSPESAVLGFLDEFAAQAGVARQSAPLPEPGVRDPKTFTAEELARDIAAVAAETDRWLDRAFAALDAEAQRDLYRALPALLRQFIEENTVSGDDDAPSAAATVLLSAAGGVDFAALGQAMATLARLISPTFLDRVTAVGERAQPMLRPVWLDRRFQGEFLMVLRTALGPILIGGAGANYYGAPAAIIVDVGGDDVYTTAPAAPSYDMADGDVQAVTSRLAAVVDLAGNDRYVGHRAEAVGAAVLGVALLLDRAGDDLYSGDRLTQAGSVLGISALLDLAGHDTYIARELGQGAALYGAALLLDARGDDLYSGMKFVQGFAGPYALARLVDLAGDDRYQAGGGYPSSYGNENAYQAYSQGMGMGFRRLAAGGVGILADGSGDDAYVADNFAQGVGYYLGFGLLADHAGTDRYDGTRYCQGAAAHLGVGVLLEYGGNDSYAGQVAANQGGAWDLAVAGLFDYGGDDSYAGAELALGGAAQNGVGLFFDGAGRDSYRTTAKALGFGGSLSYGDGRGAKNLGLFLDAGGEMDDYGGNPAANNTFRRSGDIGVFADE